MKGVWGRMKEFEKVEGEEIKNVFGKDKGI